ncbi:MAG: T9SS type A sorting domain-containing protein [Tannerella sp.]|nr:T9SS type A sorting domain-containing protein [Tannerella sp.]
MTSDPESIDFGEVIEGESKSETVTVTLSDPFTPLTESAFTLAVAVEGIFEIVSVESVGEASDGASVVEVTLSFTPAAAQEYLDTLIVRADYAEEVRISLSGTGTSNVAISGPQAASPSLSVRNGDIVVSRASTGNRIFVYNLQGQALKVQTVTSDAEILETASFPRGVYIVSLWNDKQEILKRKVVL